VAAADRRGRQRPGSRLLTPLRAPRPLPIVLVQTGVRWLVVGGGRVAERKLRVLLGAGADVLVVAPRATEAIMRWARAGRLRWRRAAYRSKDVQGVRFVLAATSDSATNRAVARGARGARAFVGVVDDPTLCTLFMPATLRRGDLVVSVSTLGRFPGLARAVRDELARHVGPGHDRQVRILGSMRRRLQREFPDRRERARLIRNLLREPLPDLVPAGARGAIHRSLVRRTTGRSKRKPGHGSAT
jgi:siroheme synthase-like protein